MKINVENFGKIKSAYVTVGAYTIFIGDNNSGKTYLMQLIYGVFDALVRRLSCRKQPVVWRANVKQVEEIANEWLNANKESIVFETFKKNIPIESLRVEFDGSEKEFFVRKMSAEEYNALKGDNGTFFSENTDIIFAINENGRDSAFYKIFAEFEKHELFMQNEMLRYAVKRLLGIPDPTRNIFLPASRSGLMLTRPFIFAKKPNEDVLRIDGTESKRNIENEFGLTQPVFEFLHFLQTHKSSEKKSERRRALVSFINENIIHGQLKKTENESFYQPAGSEEWLPPSITSSMVNEISPVMQIITSVRDFAYVFYDEIETCQHPTTQIEMAKLLNRMVNVGYKMIVSTHSDTMATAINLAIGLDNAKVEKLQTLGYAKDDVLKNGNVHAYQFMQEDGLTVVKEVQRNKGIGLGFDFTLFNKANKKLFDAYQLLT